MREHTQKSVASYVSQVHRSHRRGDLDVNGHRDPHTAKHVSMWIEEYSSGLQPCMHHGGYRQIRPC